MRVRDKVAVVTGSGSGMGRAIAHRLAAEGTMVVVADISDTGMNATLNALSGRGLKAAGEKMDVANRDHVQRAMQSIVDKHGRIDRM